MLASVAQLKTFLGITVTTYDTLLEDILKSVTKYIQNYTGRELEQAAITDEAFSTNGLNRIFAVRESPIDTVATFTMTFDGDAVDSDDYEILYEDGIIVFDFPPVRGTNKLLISYTGGYAADEIPKDLELATTKIAAGIFKNRKTTSGVTSKKLGDFSITYAQAGDSDLDAVITANQNILNMYRRLTV